MTLALSIILVLSSVLMIILVLLHKGKGSGLSDLFGGGVSSTYGAEPNKMNITVVNDRKKIESVLPHLEKFLDNIVSNLSFFPDSHNSWVSYDFKYSLDEVNMTGASRINDSINSKISILKNISPSEILTDRFIPNSFSSFFSFTIDDSERFIFNFKNYLKGNDISTENINFDSLNLINEINFIEDQEKFIILGINNINNLESYFELSEFDNLSNIKKINIDKGIKILINSFNQDISTNYATLIDNSLVITKSVSQIKKIIGQIDKQVEVIKAYYHPESDTIYQESCMFKMKSDLLFEERQIQNIIKDSGWDAYEISNYSKFGFRSKHNSNYWRGKPYFGIGPSAHSFDGQNLRSWNVSNNSKYIEGEITENPQVEYETLSDLERVNELIMTKLRTSEGLDLRELNTLDIKFHNSNAEFIKIAEKNGWMISNNRNLTLTNEGKLMSDYIISELMLIH